GEVEPLEDLRIVGLFGDSITTDHISPAGAIALNSPAGEYLQGNDVSPRNFNSYGSRRGNNEVMMRGTFANIRIRNKITPHFEGEYTIHWTTDKVMNIYDAAMKYKEEGTGLIVIGGEDYGMGSSRDWAAKGADLLGIETVIAKSYERIHRANLVMMGILPLQFEKGEDAESIGLTGKEVINVLIDENVKPNEAVKVTATDDAGEVKEFNAIARFDSEVEIDYYRNGGILQMVLR